MKWPLVSLERIALVNPKNGDLGDLPDDLLVGFVPMQSVSEEAAAITTAEVRPLGEVRRGYTAFREHDVLFAKITPCMENGKIAIARGLPNGIGFGSTEFHVLRAGASVLPEYLYYFLRQGSFRAAAKRHMRGGAGQQRVPEDFVRKERIPLPPVSEQRRIVEILDQADRLRRLRAEADAKADRILPAILTRVLGSPASWFSDPGSRALGDLVEIVSGATPSKANELYWSGGVPWVSPKDMKRDFLADSEDHVSRAAVLESNLKLVEPGSVLIVVRGMILARDVPVALNLVPVTINQDMKALIPRGNGITGSFLWAVLHVARTALRTLVRTAAHGTRKLETPELMQFRVVVPAAKHIARIDAAVRDHQAFLSRRERSKNKINRLFDVLLGRAFDGTLTASWREAHMKELLQEMEQQAKALTTG